MTVGADFIEMAQLLGDAALPAEAQAVLEKAMSKSLIGDQQKERTTRLLNSFKSRAEADKKGQAQFEAEATKNPAGELDVKLGEVYFGSGDYQNAVTAITRGLQKQQIKHLDEAYVYLGRAQVQLKNAAEAKKAFMGLKTVPNISARVLKLWELYAETIR
jgi:tetratricopeptide (TPR) repeat protein